MINERSNRVVDEGGGESVAKSHCCHCHRSLFGVVCLCERECLEFMERFFIWRGGGGVGVGGLVGEVDL